MKKWINASTVATIILIGGVASAEDKDQAQESSGRSSRLGAATHSAELTIGTGYAQGFGKAGSGEPSLTDVGKAGGGVQAGVAYRLYPQLALGVYGSWAIYGRGDQADPTGNEYSATAGVQGDWHFLPAGYEFDPWVSLGSGWRGYWETADRGTTAMHGWEIAKLQVGVDYRIVKAVAVSPVVGVDLTTFFTKSTPDTQAFHSISSPDVSAFLFAGVQGRFDIPVGPDTSQVASR